MAREKMTASAASETDALSIGDMAVMGPIADAADFNAIFPEPGTGNGLPSG